MYLQLPRSQHVLHQACLVLTWHSLAAVVPVTKYAPTAIKVKLINNGCNTYMHVTATTKMALHILLVIEDQLIGSMLKHFPHLRTWTYSSVYQPFSGALYISRPSTHAKNSHGSEAFSGVCRSVILSVHTITKKSQSVQTWYREWSWDILKVAWFWGQSHSVTKFKKAWLSGQRKLAPLASAQPLVDRLITKV